MTTPTDSTVDEKILNRIRGLLAKADGGATAEECQVYSEKAAELMAKHAVDLAMVSDSAPVDDPVVHLAIRLTGSYENPKAILLAAMAKPMSCSVIHGHNGELHLFGHRSDAEHVKALFHLLLVQALRGVAIARPAYSRGASSVAAYRRAYLAGFATAIAVRMTAGRAQAVREHTAAGTGGELVLVRRADEAKALQRETFPRTRVSRPRYSSVGGYAAGMAAGGRADFGRGHVAGGRAAIGS